MLDDAGSALEWCRWARRGHGGVRRGRTGADSHCLFHRQWGAQLVTGRAAELLKETL